MFSSYPARSKPHRADHRERWAMNTKVRVSMLASVALLAVAASAPAQAQSNNMTFFVTSNGPGKGADLGGLAGADAQCAKLAQAAGAGAKTWRAYLSTPAP